jgi:hypothetical protein
MANKSIANNSLSQAAQIFLGVNAGSTIRNANLAGERAILTSNQILFSAAVSMVR